MLTSVQKKFDNCLVKKMKRLLTTTITLIAFGSLLMSLDSYVNHSLAQNMTTSNKQSTSVSIGGLGGIKYEVRGTGGTSVSSVNNSTRITSGDKIVTINKGRITLNGEDRGAIETGDSVLLDEDGKLYVNGEKR